MALRGLLIALEIFLVLRLTAILLFAKNTPNSDLNDLVNSNASFHKRVLNFGQEILSRLQTQSNYTSPSNLAEISYFKDISLQGSFLSYPSIIK